MVIPRQWLGALEPWQRYREQQGYQVFVVEVVPNISALKEAIATIASQPSNNLQFVMLCADVGPGLEESQRLGTFYHASSALVQFGGDKLIATDNDFADLDDDDIPDLAVGRIPADSSVQLADYLQRVMDYENTAVVSDCCRNVHVVAGVGGFGALADLAIESTTRSFLASRFPPWINLSMTQASLDSHFCPDPLHFDEACLSRLNSGGMFWIYIGHGHIKTLDYMLVNETYLPILNTHHLPAVDIQGQAPVAAFLACYTGAFDAVEDSLAESLTMLPRGPIASIAASRVSGPYGMAILADGLLEENFERQTATLGEQLRNAKRQSLLMDDKSDQLSNQLRLINSIASAMTPENYDLLAERREHVWQMNLLGDPVLHLRHAPVIQLKVEGIAQPGHSIRVTGSSPLAGQLAVEFAYRRDQRRRDVPSLPTAVIDVELGQQFQARYEKVLSPVLSVVELKLLRAGEFECEVPIPSDIPRGTYHIRALISDNNQWAAGYADVSLRRSPVE